jgi:hypothetical protein
MRIRIGAAAHVMAAVAALFFTLPTRAHAAEQFCDPAFQDCRTPLLNLINAEQQASTSRSGS